MDLINCKYQSNTVISC